MLLGQKIEDRKLSQQELDTLIEQDLLRLHQNSYQNCPNMKSRIDRALDILVQIGLPKQQLNERSALTLLA